MMPRKIARKITPDYLHNAALYYLERYAASVGRVRQVLLNKIKRSCRDHPEQIEADLIPLVDQEIATLTRVELVNDGRLIEQLVTGYRGRGQATRLIDRKLQAKGFTKELIAQALAATGEDQIATEIDAARRYLTRRKLYPFLKEPAPDRTVLTKAKQKAWAALARQGYDPDVIEQAMRP